MDDDGLDRYLNEMAELQDEIDELADAADSIRDEYRMKQDQRRAAVIGALYEIQGSLDAGETYELFEASEFGRNGSYRFTEVLTQDGIRTDDVQRVNSAGEVMEDAHIALYSCDDEPLRPEEYLDHPQRGRSAHIDKLAERLQTREPDELPTVHYQGRPA